MSAQMKTCDYHRSESVEAEVQRTTVVTTESGTKRITYVVLRCPDEGCGRIRGIRRNVEHLDGAS